MNRAVVFAHNMRHN